MRIAFSVDRWLPDQPRPEPRRSPRPPWLPSDWLLLAFAVTAIGVLIQSFRH